MKRHFSLVNYAQKIITAKLHTGGTAIDATVGNGHDTVFLAQQVGVNGRVYGFDIQEIALELTAKRLTEAGLEKQVRLIHSGHQSMQEPIPPEDRGRIDAVMFNLGYLPGGDKSIITAKENTLKAVKTAADILAPDGLLTIIAYPGHPGGKHETDAIHELCQGLDSKFVCEHLMLEKDSAPRLFIITGIVPLYP